MPCLYYCHMNIQIIEKNGKPEWAVIPYKRFLHLSENADLQEDLRLYQKASSKKNPEFVPSEVVDRIIDGENLIRVWRKYRGFTQQQLADEVEISKAYLSQIESEKRTGTAETLTALAKALKLKVDDLIR